MEAVFVYNLDTESMRTVQQQNYIKEVFHADTAKDIGSQLLLLVEKEYIHIMPPRCTTIETIMIQVCLLL